MFPDRVGVLCSGFLFCLGLREDLRYVRMVLSTGLPLCRAIVLLGLLGTFAPLW